jgi:hypothetical protein
MESDVLIQMPTRRLVVSSHFQLNCSTTFYQSQNLTVELFWMVPQLQGIDVSFSIKFTIFFFCFNYNTNTIETTHQGRRVRSEKIVLNATPRGGKKRTTVRSSLRVVNATLDDSGLYMCASHQSSKETSTMEWAEVFVNIHRIQNKRINSFKINSK